MTTTNTTTPTMIRQLARMAGERVAEMLHWRTMGDLEFAIAIWRRGDAQAITYASRQDDLSRRIETAARETRE